MSHWVTPIDEAEQLAKQIAARFGYANPPEVKREGDEICVHGSWLAYDGRGGKWLLSRELLDPGDRHTPPSTLLGDFAETPFMDEAVIMMFQEYNRQILDCLNDNIREERYAEETDGMSKALEHCRFCGEPLTGGSHYHCPNCLERCSMMGHYDFAKQDYSCKRHPGADKFDTEDD